MSLCPILGSLLLVGRLFTLSVERAPQLNKGGKSETGAPLGGLRSVMLANLLASIDRLFRLFRGKKSFALAEAPVYPVFRGSSPAAKASRSMAESSRNVIPLGGTLPSSIPAASKELLDLITTANRQAMPQYVGCLICQKEFKQKPTLLQRGCVHIEARPYPCTECGKRFRQQSHLTQHLRIHSDKKPFECMYCGKCFRQRTTLNQHLRIHTDEKPYKCSECGKDFRQKAILDQHYRTHLGDDRSYCCPISSCRRRFHTEEQMNRHIDNHPALRGEPGGPPAKRPREHPNEKPQELYMPQGYSQVAQAAAAAAAFQQQYTLQLLQPPPGANSQASVQ
ncbi:hypothetical protein GE061_003528 [Apolygus lucorum]|uniref:C2H2-type domain-containing protein n=1 Tax=Apolygus lucorum TaxID=248454 RepID=A0A6A4J3L8_APOLU|nr:hypothetical protein GE061_003528 [Apolygus lucorum]